MNESRFRILLVEDNAGDVYLLRKALTAAQVAFDWTVLERLIAQKRKGQKVTTVEQPRKAPVIDLVEALQRSLASSSKRSGSANVKRASAKRKAA